MSTRWTVVVAAGQSASPESDQALAELCETYWFPLYTYVRRKGYSREDAQDLVQEFFARLLNRNHFHEVSSARGKFRAYLLACLQHFLANEWDRAMRQKRGGKVEHISLDWHSADERYAVENTLNASPEAAFDHAWAITVLEVVIRDLQNEYELAGKAELFGHLRDFLVPGGKASESGEVARTLGIDEGTLRVTIHRLRKRYRELLKEEIAQTLASPSNVGEELQALKQALLSG